LILIANILLQYFIVLGESGDFAKACIENGIRFVGPSPDVMYRMGNKTAASKAAIEAGLYLTYHNILII